MPVMPQTVLLRADVSPGSESRSAQRLAIGLDGGRAAANARATNADHLDVFLLSHKRSLRRKTTNDIVHDCLAEYFEACTLQGARACISEICSLIATVQNSRKLALLLQSYLAEV